MAPKAKLAAPAATVEMTSLASVVASAINAYLDYTPHVVDKSKVFTYIKGHKRHFGVKYVTDHGEYRRAVSVFSVVV